MTFTTPTFLAFLAVVFAAYWAVPRRRVQNGLLLVASYVFYGWWDWRFCGLMLATSLLDFAVGLAIHRSESLKARRAWLTIAVVSNLSVLGFFKYFNFFAESLAEAAGSVGWSLDAPTLRIILPVGISFYTFQSLSYTIDIYRRTLTPTSHLIDYLAFVSFFPQLVAGPIERASRLLPQFLSPRRFDAALATDGCRLMLWGFFKKVAVADNAARFADAVFAEPENCGGLRIAFGAAMFAVQIYCDFSAYSDIARGTARLFGFELMQNFLHPYFATSLADFWRRWHVSLSTWFKDYVYIPLGGSRRGLALTLRNLLITFTVSGLWHGAAWTFVVWGVWHGLFLAAEVLAKAVGVAQVPRLLSEIVGRAYVLTAVGVGWVFFRAESISDARLMLTRMLTDPLGLAGPTFNGVPTQQMLALVSFVFVAEWLVEKGVHRLPGRLVPRPVRWAAYSTLFWATVYYAAPSASGFIYFQF